MKEIKWWGTILCLLGIFLTSFNVYPLNILFGFIGSGLWTLAGYMQDDTPLMVVEAVAVALYFFGICSYIIVQVSQWIA